MTAAAPPIWERARPRLPGRTGTVPAIVCLVVLALLAVVFAFSPTLDPIAILSGRFLDVPVPRVVDQTQDRALIELERGRLRGNVSFVYSSQVDRGKVVRQAPRSGASLRRGSIVNLLVSRGPAFITLPDFTRKARGEVVKTLHALGLEVTEERTSDELVPSGAVISQKPRPGVVVEGGSTVALKVSTGPVTRTVPEVAGLPVEGAAFLLGRAGFQLGAMTSADNPLLPKGAVVGTDPPAGTVLPRDTAVKLVTSNGPPPVFVPKVTGLSRASAADILTKLGLIIGEVTEVGVVNDPLAGTVLRQNPDPGTQLRPGEVVNLTVRRSAPPPTTAPPSTAPTETIPPTPPPGG